MAFKLMNKPHKHNYNKLNNNKQQKLNLFYNNNNNNNHNNKKFNYRLNQVKLSFLLMFYLIC
jgi:hypothetical protein